MILILLLEKEKKVLEKLNSIALILWLLITLCSKNSQNESCIIEDYVYAVFKYDAYMLTDFSLFT